MRQRCLSSFAVLAMLLATLFPLAIVTTSASAAVSARQGIDSWQVLSFGNAQGEVMIDGTDPHSGRGALSVQLTSPRVGGDYSAVVNSVLTEGGASYTLSGWVSTRDVAAADANFIVVVGTADGNTVLPLGSGTTGWLPFTTTFTAPNGGGALPVWIVSQEAGTVRLDDIAVVKDGSNENILANGDFEVFDEFVNVTSPSLVFAPGDARIDLSASGEDVTWLAIDQDGRSAGSGTVEVTGGAATLDLHALPAGYYDLDLRTGLYRTSTSFAVIADLGRRPTMAIPHLFGTTIHPDYAPLVDNVTPLEVIGATSARFDLRWQHIEPTAGDYTFSNPLDYDALIDALETRGIRPLVVLGFANPLYDSDLRPYSVEGRAAYAAYAGAIAERFGDRVDYEIYNEYNHPTGYHLGDESLGQCNISVACYTAMFDPTVTAIRAFVPDATVTTASVAGSTEWWFGGGDPLYSGAAVDWTRALLATPSADEADVLNIHNYDMPFAPEGYNERVLALAQDLLDEAGRDVPIWFTETGWATPTSLGGFNSEAEQAAFTVRDAALSMDAGLEKYMQYGLYDDYADDTVEARFGLFRNYYDNRALTPKRGAVTTGVFTRQVDGTGVIGRDDLGDGAFSILFGADATADVRVAWATEHATVAVQATGVVTVTSAYGVVTELTPVDGVARLQLTGDPQYITGPVTGVTREADAVFVASAPEDTPQHSVVPVSVAVELSNVTLPSNVVSFSSGTASVDVAAVPEESASATLQVAAFARTGPKTIPVRVSIDGATVALLYATTAVSPDPQLSVRAAGTSVDAGPLELTASYRGGGGATLDQVDYTVGGFSGAIAPAMPTGSDPVSVELPVSGLETWHPYLFTVDASFATGASAQISGTTVFAPVVADDAQFVPTADLAASARWVSLAGEEHGAPAGLSGAFSLTTDGDDFILRAEIVDDQHTPGPTASTLWQGDSVQFAFSPQTAEAANVSNSFGVALLAEGPAIYRFGGAAADVSAATAAVTRDEATHRTNYLVRIPRSVAGVDAAAERFSFSVVVNDANGAARVGYLEWGSGIGNVGGPSQYLPVYVVSEEIAAMPTPTPVPTPTSVASAGPIATIIPAGNLAVTGGNSWWGFALVGVALLMAGMVFRGIRSRPGRFD